MLKIMAILEFDVGVLVNKPRFFVDGYNRELPKFGMGALNYRENVWRKRLIETILYWFVDFTHLKLCGIDLLWLLDFFFIVISK